MRSLAGKTLFVTRTTWDIGKATALRAAADGANVVFAAKTAEPHPKPDKPERNKVKSDTIGKLIHWAPIYSRADAEGKTT